MQVNPKQKTLPSLFKLKHTVFKLYIHEKKKKKMQLNRIKDKLKTWICTTFKPFFCQHQGNGIRFSITIYRHVIIHAQCQQVAHWHSKIWKTWHRETEGKKGIGEEEGERRRNKRIAAWFGCFGSRERKKDRERGGRDTEGQIDTITIHMLGRRSPFQSHWPRNQRMAVTSFFFL